MEATKGDIHELDTEEVPLQVTVPPRIKRELDILAAGSGRTKRSMVLEALRAVGVNATDAEIAGRRPRRSPKSM